MIHPKTDIHPSAKISDNVSIGAFSVIGENVSIGEGCIIGPNVVIHGRTTLGCHNRIYQFASIGEEPIDHTYHGEPHQTIIGDHNTIREGVTIHGGTAKERCITEIGSHNLFMNYVHIGHDVVIGSHNTFVGYCGLAGHVHVADYVTIGVYCGIHQFVKIGSYSFIAHATVITMDIPPYLMITGGQKATPCGVNVIALQRNGFSEEAIVNVRKAYKVLYRMGHRLTDAIEQLQKLPQTEEKRELDLFIQALKSSSRGIVR